MALLVRIWLIKHGPRPTPLAFWRHVVNDRGLGEEVFGNRLEIAVAQIFETVLDGLAHRAIDLALLGRRAGLPGNFVAPSAWPGFSPSRPRNRGMRKCLAVGEGGQPGRMWNRLAVGDGGPPIRPTPAVGREFPRVGWRAPSKLAKRERGKGKPTRTRDKHASVGNASLPTL